ncbi:MAG TPA: site-specific integrase [Blastocatellia bacterium]|nr:site-specific integrase [Blastocatellia bacterium]
MSVKKRGDKWYYDFMVRHTRYRGVIQEARNKAQANKAEAKIRLDVYEGRFGNGSFRSFTEFVEQVYMPDAQANKRSFLSADAIHAKVILKQFGNWQLNEITPMMIEKFKRDRTATSVRGGKPRSAATVNRELQCLSKILSTARDNGLISENPCSRVKLLREDNKRTRYLTESEEEALMAVLTGKHAYLRPIVVLALQTAMRQGEIVNLRWPQVDFYRDCIYVTNTKSGKDRVVPMNEISRQELLALRDNGSERVFGNTLPQVKKSFKVATAKANIEDFRFHDLRHTAATRMADAGVDAFTIAAILGHATLQMASRYTHATDESKRKAIAGLSKHRQESCHKIVTSIVESRLAVNQ